MILVATVANILIFLKCHKRKDKKYYCNDNTCHLRYYCMRHEDKMGFILQQFAALEEQEKNNS